LNPNATTFCVSPSLQPSLSLPFTIKGTPPWSIDYEKIAFDGTVERFGNVTVAPPAAEKKTGRQMGTFTIPITEPGIYQITGVRETNGVAGRIIPSLAEVIICPDARWVLTEDGGERTVDRCVDSSYNFAIELVGTPPLRAVYSRRVGKDEVYLNLDSSDLEDVDEFALKARDIDSVMKSRLLDARPRSFRIPTEIKLELSGPHFFKLLSVSDSRNNTVVYDENGHKTKQIGNVIRSERASPDSFVVDSHPSPTAHFGKCDSIKILVGTGYETEARLPVLLDGSGPWTVSFGRSDTLEDLEKGNIADEFVLDKWEHKSLEIPITKPGLYSLKSVSDVYCPGRVELPSTCLIQQTLPPTITVSAEPIEQSCVGAIGALVNVSLTGEPPFWIEYDEIYRNVRTSRTAHLNKLRDTLSFKPSLPGTYVYEFKAVSFLFYESI
jgi:nucleoporin POM152